VFLPSRLAQQPLTMAEGIVPGVKAFYTFPPAPAAMIVDIFLREKGVQDDSIKSVEKFVDLPNMENRGDACKKMNPQGSIPWFVTLDDQVVAETIAMCEYLEEHIPEPALIGSSPTERGITRAWQRRMEEHFCSPATYAHRNWCHSDDCPNDHAMRQFYTNRFNSDQGASLLYSAPQAWNDLATWALNRLAWLEKFKQTEPSDFICGNKITMVDIQVYVNMFYWDTFCPGQHFVANLKGEAQWIEAWYARMHSRPACLAGRTHAGYKDKADGSDKET